MKTVLKIFLFIAAFIAIERFCHRQTDGFRNSKILSTLSFHPEWEISSLPPAELANMRRLLSRPFFYLGSGGQCYSFLNEDGVTVLKVFKHHHMRTNSFL